MKERIVSCPKNKHSLMSVVLLFAGLFLSAEMNAQSNLPCTFDGEDVLQLPTYVVLSENYDFSAIVDGTENISQNTQASQSVFSSAVKVEVQMVYANLEKVAYPGTDIFQWNNPLYTITNSTPLLI